MYFSPDTITPSTDTIYALSSAPGRAGVSVIRISGGQAPKALKAFGLTLQPTPRYAHYCKLRQADGSLIDDVVLLYFPAPHSYTGEHVIELHCHGSRAVIQEIFLVLANIERFRQADAGEFTRQAWWNGKMDLTQVEGIADLIDAETLEQKRQAQRFTSGEVRDTYDIIRAQLVDVLAYLEALIDFSDEEIPHETPQWVDESVDTVLETLTRYLQDGHRGEHIREGIHIVIAGPPNVGKSSLINFLAKEEVAIVSPTSGTTRDAITTHLDIAGFATTVTDTAGLHHTEDEIESEGIRRAKKKWTEADIRILMLDYETWNNHPDDSLVSESDLILINKAELFASQKPPALPESCHLISLKKRINTDCVHVNISDILREKFLGNSPSLIANQRHRSAIERAAFHVEQSKVREELELKAEEIRAASASLHEITGGLHTEDVLDKVFSSFCIGK